MTFNVVIGNPPYNDDAYLDFVTLGHKLSKVYSVWITPAKWQAKDGAKNEDFRKNIVPYMSKIVYYPYCKDVFEIVCHGGITYFLTDKNRHEIKTLNTRCNNKKIFINESNSQYINDKTYSMYGDAIERFINKIIKNKKHLYVNKYTEGEYKCKVLHVYSGNLAGLNCIGGIILAPINIEKTNYLSADHYILFSGSNSECKSFKSFMYTKFARFCLGLGVHTQHFNNDEAWRFVPDPGPFDHIFTDEELYKKYNLTPEEINIIESVIKAR